MATTITATELARSLSDILNRVRYRNESFVIQRNGETIATIMPSSPPRSVMLHDALRALGQVEFPGDGFADDLEEIQASQGKADFPDWPS
jgi:antitoxin (DNA-binding transcriptional repressor) of toxin-antitoxin stability system